MCEWDGDKIVKYPDIIKIIQKKLFDGGANEDTPGHFRPGNDDLYSH